MHHFNSKIRGGYYTVGQKFAKKKLKRLNANLKEWLKNNRNVLKFDVFMKVLDTKLTGMYHYYGVNGTMPYLKAFHNHVFFATFKWLNRRNQRKRFTLEKYQTVYKSLIKSPRIYVNVWYA